MAIEKPTGDLLERLRRNHLIKSAKRRRDHSDKNTPSRFFAPWRPSREMGSRPFGIATADGHLDHRAKKMARLGSL
jgi:hypothetical protein